MLKVVLDTNILVSSILSSGPPAAIADLVADGKIFPFYSNLILQEYYDVLSRKKFGFNFFQISRLLDDIVSAGSPVEDKPFKKNTKVHEDDQIFYNAAATANAYLITGNIRHFPTEPFIVLPAKFLAIYQGI